MASVEEMVKYLNTLRVGVQVTLTILRDNKPQQIDTTLVEWPDVRSQ